MVKLLSYDEAKDVVLTYKQKEKIQVLCVINMESGCRICKELTQNIDNPLSILEREGFIDLNVIDSEEAYGFFKPPTMFMMYYYIPWNEKHTPQIRDHLQPVDELRKDIRYWIINKKG